MIKKKEELQKIAGEHNVVETLNGILKREMKGIEPYLDLPISQAMSINPMANVIEFDEPRVLSEGNVLPKDSLYSHLFSALSYIITRDEEYQRTVIARELHKSVLRFFDHPLPKIRAAACRCIAAFARAEKTTKAALIAAHVHISLFRLLGDAYMKVVKKALGAICNLVLETQKDIMQCGEWTRLVDFTQSKNLELKRRAIFALKNLVYQVDGDIKRQVMAKLTFARLFSFLDDAEHLIQEQAIGMIRNLIHKSKDMLQEVMDKKWNDKLLTVIIETIKGLNNNLKAQAVYLLCNIASGSEKYRKMVMDLKVLNPVKDLLVNLLGTVLEQWIRSCQNRSSTLCSEPGVESGNRFG
eukprot:TRINITY_DN7061_c0_g2_i1.p1 TRINITY_DN7061_c0_g2~~TRINITY_DN7061_c0_g2_i1.p1  ORF type:complete len:355 (+),score=61.80 TRINITY_DN7061_c0_g2_i1:1804-2868(+)